MPRTLIPKKPARIARRSRQTARHDALEKARGAVTTLRMLKPLLTPQDEETLAIMMDKELMGRLEKSIAEAKAHQLEPLERILT